MKLSYLFMITALAIGCSKNSATDDGGGGTTKAKINADQLTGTGGKVWDISTLTIVYYSASGSVDSSVTKTVNASSVMFFGIPSGGSQYYVTSPLSDFLPGAGTWALDYNNQLLTLTCISPYCSTNNTAPCKITLYGPRDAYGESMEAEQEQPLSGSRKRIVKFRLYKF